MEEPPRSLPESLERILERTIDASGLRGRERRRVAAELRAHFEDALAAGATVGEIETDFGDPELGGGLIRRSPPRSQTPAAMAVRAIQLVATLATVSFVSVYGATAVRFNSFARDSGADRESLDSIAHIAALATESRTLLMQQSAKGDLASRISAVALRAEIVSQARTSTDPFARLVFSGVARDLVRAADDILADPQLSPEARRAIGIQLTRLATANALPLDSAEVFTWLDHVVERSFDANGRLTATGLRIAQAMKGARQPSVAARALEPLLFAGADDARNARISARRALSSVHASPRHSELWTTMVVRPAVDGLAAQTEVAKRLPQLIAITRR